MNPKVKTLAIPIFFLLLCGFSGLSIHRNQQWKNEEVLFLNDVIIKFHSICIFSLQIVVFGKVGLRLSIDLAEVFLIGQRINVVLVKVSTLNVEVGESVDCGVWNKTVSY